ncbi:MAG TPA: EpsD family peptidyl-prolyl cis-trans isomerase, partial [Burkholderiaceae bacterium]
MKLRARVVLSLAVVGAAVALAGCGKNKYDATPVLATVNGENVTQGQVDYVRSQFLAAHPGASAPENAQILKGLVEQRLITQKAEKEKLDRNPGVLQAIEETRKDALARFYIDELAAKVPKPGADDIKQYYDGHPLNFAQRAIYTLQKVDARVPADQLQAVVQAAQATSSADEAAAVVKAKATASNVTLSPQPAESLGGLLPRIAQLKPGQTVCVPMPGGLSAVTLVSVQPAPLTLAQATGTIENLVWNQRKREAIQAEAKTLHADAKI